jgi:hypothetical protein
MGQLFAKSKPKPLCTYPDCSNDQRYIDNLLCEYHTCRSESCSGATNDKNHPFCGEHGEHECHYENCNKKIVNSNFCSYHRCIYIDAMRRCTFDIIKNEHFCILHTPQCVYPECSDEKKINRRFCEYHICNQKLCTYATNNETHPFCKLHKKTD